jgi:hypothetical protein
MRKEVVMPPSHKCSVQSFSMLCTEPESHRFVIMAFIDLANCIEYAVYRRVVFSRE